jgi:hypothetical protein
MKSIKSLVATAILASLVFALTIQQQNVAAFNDKNNQFVYNSHNHLQISEDHGIASNSASTLNDGTSHFNDNFNDNRGETYEERYKSNSHSKPTR